MSGNLFPENTNFLSFSRHHSIKLPLVYSSLCALIDFALFRLNVFVLFMRQNFHKSFTERAAFGGNRLSVVQGSTRYGRLSRRLFLVIQLEALGNRLEELFAA